MLGIAHGAHPTRSRECSQGNELRPPLGDDGPHDGVSHQQDEQGVDEEPAFHLQLYLVLVRLRPEYVLCLRALQDLITYPLKKRQCLSGYSLSLPNPLRNRISEHSELKLGNASQE